MKRATTLAIALLLATWPLGRIGAAPRCYPTPRFTVSSGLVTDALTGLKWKQQVSPSAMTWAAATTYCPVGFRLPTYKELVSIVDLQVAPPGPTIDTVAFPGTPAEGFWTSTKVSSGIPYSFYVDFSRGVADDNEVTLTFRVRCVQ